MVIVMSLLAKHSLSKEDKSNIITLGTIAQKEKEKDPSVINATIGMLYDESDRLLTFKTVEKALAGLNDVEKYAYPSTPGNPDFHKALKHWVFQEYEEEILSNLYCEIMATPGGTGALSNTFSNYLNVGEKVLIPSYMWGNYKQLAYENFASFATYELFNSNGGFNLMDLNLKMQKMKLEQSRIVLIINDPCQNPTGYCMTREEWVGLINLINEITADGTPFILIHDMAYIDYDYRGIEFTRNNLRLFEKLNENVLTILAFSCSKTLGLYGMRLGAQIALSKNEENIKEFAAASKFSSRSKWSTANNMGMNIASRAFTDPKLEAEFRSELEAAKLMLEERAKVFLKECKRVNLETLPFNCGFFISIPCENAMSVYEKLVKEKVHIIPFGKFLRVTIAAISLSECEKVPELIKKAL